MKTSLIMTVYNEGKTIKEQIDSFFDQTKIPDEIIILDNLSKDDTTKIIKSYKDRRIKLIEKRADIGTARNIAIKEAKNEIILVTDGGCLLDKNWVHEISKPFEDKSVDVVGGIYLPFSKNFFEKCEGAVVCKNSEEINEKKFIPSSRSLAFRKNVWKGVGSYPKHEIGGEDTRFVLNIINKNYKIIINKKAVVYWRMRSPLKNFIRQFYLYAKGEVRSGNLVFRQLRFVLVSLLLFPVYLFFLIFGLVFVKSIFILLLASAFLYFLYNGIKVAVEVKDIRGIYYGFFLTFLKRFVYFSGAFGELLFPGKDKYKNENY